MSHRTLQPFWLASFLVALPALASDVRVDSAGGLGLVLTDESQSAHPFNLGNPAGLVLLPERNRLDLAGQWLQQARADDGPDYDLYGTLGHLGSDADLVKYHGLLLFPLENLALQLDGDLVHFEGRIDQGFAEDGRDRTRGTFRTAYDFGPFLLGGQVQASQYDIEARAGTPVLSAVVLRGQGSGSNLHGTGGLLVPFPPEPPQGEGQFLVGGTYTRQILEDALDLEATVDLSGSSITIQQAFRNTSNQTFGPELYYRVPGSLEIVLAGRISNASTDAEMTSDSILIPDRPRYRISDSDQVLVVGGFKSSSPMVEDLDLNFGLSALFGRGESRDYDPSEVLETTTQSSGWEVQGGVGVEDEEAFTVGLQILLQGDQGESEDALSGTTTVGTDHFGYRVAVGGERWFDPRWAFRLGVAYEDDRNNGMRAFSTYFYPIPPGGRVLNTIRTMGLGFQEEFFYADLMLRYGQPVLEGAPGPEDFAAQTGVQLAAGAFFN